MLRFCFLLTCVFGWLFLSQKASAHEVDQHFIRLTLGESSLEARFEMDAGYALPEIRSNEDDTLPIGFWFSELSEAEKERILVEGEKYLNETLFFHLNGIPIETKIEFAKWGTDWDEYFEQRSDTFVRMVWSIRWDYHDQNGELELFWSENELSLIHI